MSINQLIGLIDWCQHVFWPRILTQTKEHISASLIMIRKEEDQGSSLWFWHISIVCHRIGFKIAHHTAIITQTLIFLHNFNLKLYNPTRFREWIDSNNNNTCGTISLLNLFLGNDNNGILRIIYSIITSKRITDLTHHFYISILLVNYLSICFEGAYLLSDEYPCLLYVYYTVTKSLQDSRLGFCH